MASETGEPMDYVGAKPCGCWGMLCSHRSTAKEIGEFCRKVVESGLDLQRWSREGIRAGTSQCPICRPVVQGTLSE